MTQPSDSRLDYVPLSAIHYNPAINARRDTETDVTELAATIVAQNIGQPLLLRPSEREGYEPVDGGRRLRALKLLAEQGKLSPDHPVPAYIRELDDTEAMSLSLATVITRMDLHPADEALDFNDLVKQGMKPDDIAARFGIPIRRVKQRLAIGRLPREIVDALKAGQIGLADAQAYTLLHDPGHATKLFKAGIREEWAIKKEFSKARVPGDSPEAVYVGREAYVAAGGVVDEDLFSNNVWFSDGKLLSKIFQQKLKEDEKAWLAEGWSFVVLDLDPHQNKTYSWPYLEPESKPRLTKEQKARADQLKAEIKKLRAKLRDGDDDFTVEDSDDEQGLLQLEALEDELMDLTAKTFTDAQKAKSGVVVRKSYRSIEVNFGIMKPAAAKKEARLSRQTAEDDDDAPSPVRKIEPDAEADFTQALAVEMAKVMTHALQRAIADKPAAATRLAAAVLMLLSVHVKPDGFIVEAPLRHRADVDAGVASDQARIRDAIEVNEGRFGDILGWLELREPERQIAISIATLLNLAPQNLEDMAPIIATFDPDVAAIWQPDVEFYKRMPRESLAAALGEAAIAGVTPSKKKKELVETAVRELTPKGWLPKPLRTPSYKGPGSNAWADAQGAAAVEQLSKEKAA